MSDLLFTFNSQQLTPNSLQNQPVRSVPASAELQPKPEIPIRNIRTKRMKRYDKIFEPDGIRKLTTEPQRLLKGLYSRASENLAMLSENAPLTLVRSIQTIGNEPRSHRSREIATLECLSTKEQQQPASRALNSHALGISLRESQKKQREIINKKRGLSLKEEPMVSYPSNQKRLPNAFRSKSISQGKQTLPKARNIQQQCREQTSETKTPKVIRSSVKKIYYQFSNPPRSEKLLPEIEVGSFGRRSECLNGEDEDIRCTPYFNPE